MDSPEILQELLSVALSPGFPLRREQLKALRNIMTCRTIERGGRIARCPNCNTKIVLYNPCNQRGCPVCYKKNQVQWKNKLQRKLLPIGHYHLVFSIPETFTFAWLAETKAVSDTLFHCVQLGIKQLQKETGLMFGSILVFQSHGKGLSYKPHMHCILTPGGIDQKKKWVSCGSIPYNRLIEIVRETFPVHLQKKVCHGYRMGIKELSDHADKRQWRIHPTFHQNTGDGIVEYLSHSISGVVIDMNQPFEIDHDKETITFQEYHIGKTIKTTLDRETFTDRYLNHIPPEGSVTIRYYGLYSNRHTDELESVREGLANRKENREGEEEGDRCPHCDSVLETIEVFSQGTHRLYFSRYGYTNGPPIHGEELSELSVSQCA
jgi:Putative transposase/Transposase zinc-binding domain